MKGTNIMKRISFICLILILTMTASLLTSCLDREASNDLELLVNSIQNSSASFTNSAVTDEPDFTNGMKLSVKTDLSSIFGFRIDADITAKNGDSTVIGFDLYDLLIEGESINGISAVVSADELALKVKAVKDSYVGLNLNNLKTILAEKFLTELPEETIEQINTLRDSLRNSIVNSASSAPQLTSKQIEFLYNKLIEKNIISAEKKDNVTVISFKGNGSDFIDSFKVFVDELKKDEKWSKHINDLGEKLKSALEASGEVSIDGTDDVYGYIYDSLEIDETLKNVAVDVKVSVTKIKSLGNKTFVTAAEMSFTVDGETVNAIIEAAYEGDPFFKITVTSPDEDETILISLDKKSNTETSSTVTFLAKCNEQKLAGASYTFDTASGSYEILIDAEIEDTMQQITVEGTFKSSKEAVELTVDLVGLDAVLIRPYATIKLVPLGESEGTMPTYTSIDKISDEELLAFFEFFGLMD